MTIEQTDAANNGGYWGDHALPQHATEQQRGTSGQQGINLAQQHWKGDDFYGLSSSNLSSAVKEISHALLHSSLAVIYEINLENPESLNASKALVSDLLGSIDLLLKKNADLFQHNEHGNQLQQALQDKKNQLLALQARINGMQEVGLSIGLKALYLDIQKHLLKLQHTESQKELKDSFEKCMKALLRLIGPNHELNPVSLAPVAAPTEGSEPPVYQPDASGRFDISSSPAR